MEGCSLRKRKILLNYLHILITNLGHRFSADPHLSLALSPLVEKMLGTVFFECSMTTEVRKERE